MICVEMDLIAKVPLIAAVVSAKLASVLPAIMVFRTVWKRLWIVEERLVVKSAPTELGVEATLIVCLPNVISMPVLQYVELRLRSNRVLTAV